MSDPTGNAIDYNGSTVSGVDTVYTAFGERVVNTFADGGSDRYGYVGAHGYQSHDSSEMPFLHVGARYYDPASGRFLQRDPIGIRGGLNVYEYTRSGPTSGLDPSGLQVGSPAAPDRATEPDRAALWDNMGWWDIGPNNGAPPPLLPSRFERTKNWIKDNVRDIGNIIADVVDVVTYTWQLIKDKAIKLRTPNLDFFSHPAFSAYLKNKPDTWKAMQARVRCRIPT